MHWLYFCIYLLHAVINHTIEAFFIDADWGTLEINLTRCNVPHVQGKQYPRSAAAENSHKRRKALGQLLQ